MSWLGFAHGVSQVTLECDGGPVQKKIIVAKDWVTLQRRIREVFDLTGRQMFHLTSINLTGSHQDPCCV